MRGRALGAIAFVTGAAISCGLVTGVGDLKEANVVTPDGGSDRDVTSGGDAQAGIDVAADTGLADVAPSDAVIDVVSEQGCVSAGPEICTDGIDNDCNGLADCADPMCAAFECVHAPAAGFSLVALAQAARSACPSGYGGPSDLLVDPSLGPFTCGCSCSVGSAPSCTTGTIPIEDSCTTPLSTGANGGGCTVHDFTDATHSLLPVPATGGTCASASSSMPPSTGTGGRSCAAGGVGGGCTAGHVCVARPAAPFDVCIAKAGSASCPSAYPTAHTAGSGLASDTRGCAACAACAAPTATCANASMSFYKDSLCGTLVGTLPADGKCDSTNWTAAAYIYSATVANVQCAAPAPGTPTGSATLAGPETLCCL